jgi:molybdate transport system ATP-binding protein
VVSLAVAARMARGGFVLDARFEAPHGVTALFGPSGAGKTLTLRAVAGLERIDAGRIVLGDRVLTDPAAGAHLPARERRIGYLFQQYALFPHMDVIGNVTYPLAGRPRAERNEEGRRVLARVGLEGFERRLPRELSGGEQQRVALARALASGPELLLLDEPFAALDGRIRARLRGELRRLQLELGTPMVLVTHDLAEVRQLADTLVLYGGGRVLRAGPAGEVLRDPGSAEAAELLAEADG